MAAPISNLRSKLLSDNWYVLRNWSFRYRRRDGREVEMKREVFDRGDGATILLVNRDRRSVILTRQFRLPTYLNGHPDGMFIETAAGLLDEDSPAEAIRREVAEETGYSIGPPTRIMDLFMSPGALTERIHFFLAEVTDAARTGAGGGLDAENEDIEVLEIPFAEALGMIESGDIRDAKTVLLLLYAQARNVI